MYGKRIKREREGGRVIRILQRAIQKKGLENTGETYSTSIHSETKF